MVKKVPTESCWKCDNTLFIKYKHLRSRYVIYVCAKCYAPYDLNDKRGLKLMEKEGEQNEAAAVYAKTWREYLGTVRRT
jgi:hypothetical protein